MEKFKENLKKSMFERINGVDIEKLSTSELMRQVKLLPALFIIMVVCAVFIAVFGVVFSLASDSELAMFSLFFFAFALVAFFLAYIFPKRLKNVKAALATREITDETRKNAEAKVNATKKAALIGLIAIIIINLIGCFFIVKGEPATPKNQCQACERVYRDSDNKRSIARTHLCENCYDNYKAMEWVLD